MGENDCGAIPVVDGKETLQPLGIITDRDIVLRSLALGKDPGSMTVQDAMSGPCVTCSPDDAIEECCDTMEANQVRRVVVAGDEGKVCGIVAQADIAKTAPREKTAEVVREISL